MRKRIIKMSEHNLLVILSKGFLHELQISLLQFVSSLKTYKDIKVIKIQ